jgi:hypothetical protein
MLYERIIYTGISKAFVVSEKAIASRPYGDCTDCPFIFELSVL